MAVDAEMPKLLAFKIGLVVAGVSWGQCAISVMASPPILNSVSVFQFFSKEEVRDAEGVERVRV